MLRTIVSILPILLLTSITFAQSGASSATQSISLNVSPVIQISAVNSSNIDLDFNTTNDYSNGIESGNQEFKVQSNRDFVVNVKTDADKFSYSGSTSPAPQMPVQNTLYLAIANNNTGGTIGNQFNSYRSLSNLPQDLLLDCQNGGNQKFTVNYRATPGNNYPAGTYTIGVIYTATQP